VKYFVMFRESGTERRAIPRSVKMDAPQGRKRGRLGRKSSGVKKPRVSGAEYFGGT
jgi:hypothetical protein